MVDLRTEYPRPLLVRKDWLCLNGQWEFEIDTAEVGKYKEFWLRDSLNGEITVPYCPESTLSGIGHTDFIGCVWYRKAFPLPAPFRGKRCDSTMLPKMAEKIAELRGLPVEEIAKITRENAMKLFGIA